MSAYALLARAWGAEVRGWDRVRTPYLEQLEGIDVEISDEPSGPPEGWEAFVSTAFAGRVPGKTRAELLAMTGRDRIPRIRYSTACRRVASGFAPPSAGGRMRKRAGCCR